MKLLDSLLDAIVRLEGDALVMHVGEKPYVVTTSAPMNAFRGPLAWGQVELSSRVLTSEAVLGMLGQILPVDQREQLDEFGAIEHEIDAPAGLTERFTIVAARGGDDIWLEVRRRPIEVEIPQVHSAQSDDAAVVTDAVSRAVVDGLPLESADTSVAVAVPDSPEIEPEAVPVDDSALPELTVPASNDTMVVPLGGMDGDIPLSTLGDDAIQFVDDEPQTLPTSDEVDAMLAATATALLTSGLGADGERAAAPRPQITGLAEEFVPAPSTPEPQAVPAAPTETDMLSEATDAQPVEAVADAVAAAPPDGQGLVVAVGGPVWGADFRTPVVPQPQDIPADVPLSDPAQAARADDEPLLTHADLPAAIAIVDGPVWGAAFKASVALVHQESIADVVEAEPEQVPESAPAGAVNSEPAAIVVVDGPAWGAAFSAPPARVRHETEAPRETPAPELAATPIIAEVAVAEADLPATVVVVAGPVWGAAYKAPVAADQVETASRSEAEELLLAAAAVAEPAASDVPLESPATSYTAPPQPPVANPVVPWWQWNFGPLAPGEIAPEVLGRDDLAEHLSTLIGMASQPEVPVETPADAELFQAMFASADAEVPAGVPAIDDLADPAGQRGPAWPAEPSSPQAIETSWASEAVVPVLVSDSDSRQQDGPAHPPAEPWPLVSTELVAESRAALDDRDTYVAAVRGDLSPDPPAFVETAGSERQPDTAVPEHATLEQPDISLVEPRLVNETSPDSRELVTEAPAFDVASPFGVPTSTTWTDQLSGAAVAAAETGSAGLPAVADSGTSSDADRSSVVVPMARTPVRQDVSVAGQPDDGQLQHTLRIAAARGASTVYVVAQSRPMIRVDGEISQLDSEAVLTADDVERLVMELAPPRRRDALQNGPVEWMADVPEVGRVRCLTFRDHRGPGVIFRMIPPRAISADQLGLSSEVQALCAQPDGFVLVTGARASGKSTLLSAFVDLINRTRSDHVITVESQIGFVHESRRSFISQREVRGDSDSAAATIRSALREDPDVLVIEDLRSADIVSVALEAAESGRLVFGSVPASSTIAAIERLVELFPAERRAKARTSLAGALRGVVSQVLLRKIKGGRVSAREVLLNTPAVSALILEGKTFQLPVALDSGRRHGMVPLTDSLAGLVREGTVHVSEAYRKALDRAALLTLLKREGVDTSFAERLA